MRMLSNISLKGVFANFVGPELPDLIAGLVSLISLIGFVQFWKPKYRAEFAASLTPINSMSNDEENNSRRNSSINRNDTTAEKVQAEGSSVPGEKFQDTQIEDKNAVPCDGEAEEAPAGLLVERPNMRETLLAWSPWVIIVVVVIM